MTRPATRARGSGRAGAVVLLHGIGGGAAMWDDDASGTAAAVAAAGWRAVAVDLPGYGDSAALGPPDMDRFVVAVDAVVGAQLADGIDRVVLLGHSMGGMIAQEVAARSPSSVAGLVLACTSAAFGGAGGDWQQRFVAERLAPLDAGLGMAEVAARLVPAMVAPDADRAGVAAATAVMSRVPESTYRAALQAIVRFDRRAALASIAVPTLVLAASHDRTAPPDVMRRMADRIAGAEYRCIDGAGHIANVERPAAFNAAVVDFLQRRFGAG